MFAVLQAIRIDFCGFTIPTSMISRYTHPMKAAFRRLPARLPLCFVYLLRFECLLHCDCDVEEVWSQIGLMIDGYCVQRPLPSRSWIWRGS